MGCIIFSIFYIRFSIFWRKDCKEQIILPARGEQPFTVNITGLEIMNDDPAEVDVLYAKVDDPSGELQQAAEAIVDR